MTICLATPEYGPIAGGIATFYENLASILADKGHTVIVLTVDTENQHYDDETKKNNNITVITLRRSYKECFSSIRENASRDALYVASAIATGTAMKKWLLANYSNYNIEIIETVDVNGLGSFLIDPALPAVVICGHGTVFQISKYDFTIPDKRFKILETLEKNTLQDADLVITHSLLNQKVLEENCKTEVQFATIPWIKTSSKKSANTLYDALVIGRMQNCKGTGVVANALRKAKEEGLAINLTWIGNDTHTAPYGSLWSKYLSRKYPDIWKKSFLWIPAVPKNEIPGIIASSRVIIIPSIWEVFGYVAVEAMTAGKPIIISKGAGSSYIFENTNAALLVPGNDPAVLLDAIKKSLSSPVHDHLEESYHSLIQEKLSPELSYSQRMKAYNMAVINRANRSKFEPTDLLTQKNMTDLRLPFTHYINKQILKIKARF